MEKILKNRVTKKGVETYEIVSNHEGFREFLVVYPSNMSDPFYDGFYEVADRLEKKGLFFTLYPYADDLEFKHTLLKNNRVIGEVVL